MFSVNFKFYSKEASEEFIRWLCNSGEQNYWEFIELIGAEPLCNDFNYKNYFNSIENKEVIIER